MLSAPKSGEPTVLQHYDIHACTLSDSAPYLAYSEHYMMYPHNWTKGRCGAWVSCGGRWVGTVLFVGKN